MKVSNDLHSWDASRLSTAVIPRDPQAVAQLHAQYAGYRNTGMGQRQMPWTREAVLALGQLFVAAYGRMPPIKRLSNAYSMPELSTVQRLFGTLAHYHAALGEG